MLGHCQKRKDKMLKLFLALVITTARIILPLGTQDRGVHQQTIQHHTLVVKHSIPFDEQIVNIDQQVNTKKEIEAESNPAIKALLERRLVDLLKQQEISIANSRSISLKSRRRKIFFI